MLTSAPPLRTLERWRRESSHPRAPPKRSGAIGKLDEEQLAVVAGYALFLLSRRYRPHCDSLLHLHGHQRACYKVLGIETHARTRLLLSSAAAVLLPLLQQHALPVAIDFVNATRPQLLKLNDRSRIVAMDQLSFWDKDNGLITSCYAPIGG